MANQGFGSIGHLATRFFGALSPAGPNAEDDQWALDRLLPGEQGLWRRMSGPDRRHAVGVARDTITLLGSGDVERPVVAAALLHDVGKVESGFGTFARVGITVAALLAGRDRLVAWSGAEKSHAHTNGSADHGARPRLRQRVGLYLVHDRLGAELLSAAGADRLTSAWAGEHHLPPDRWSVDRHVADALKEADGD